jgi:hypothetical protein
MPPPEIHPSELTLCFNKCVWIARNTSRIQTLGTTETYYKVMNPNMRSLSVKQLIWRTVEDHCMLLPDTVHAMANHTAASTTQVSLVYCPLPPSSVAFYRLDAHFTHHTPARSPTLDQPMSSAPVEPFTRKPCCTRQVFSVTIHSYFAHAIQLLTRSPCIDSSRYTSETS